MKHIFFTILIVNLLVAICRADESSQFDLETWKQAGGLCAMVTENDGREYVSRTIRENSEDADYNITTIYSKEDCVLFISRMILMMESLRFYLPDFAGTIDPYSNGLLYYNDNGNIKTCNVVALKPAIDLLPRDLVDEIIKYIGKPIPNSLRQKFNESKIEDLIKQNISISCDQLVS